eukprot:6277974-Pyramimonas_sp.AAC.1
MDARPRQPPWMRELPDVPRKSLISCSMLLRRPVPLDVPAHTVDGRLHVCEIFRHRLLDLGAQHLSEVHHDRGS